MPGWNCSAVAPASRAKGCLAQAIDDAVGGACRLRRIVRSALFPTAVAAASVLAFSLPVAGTVIGPVGLACSVVLLLCCGGYGVAWGRELSAPHGFDADAPVARTSLLSLGFFGGALHLVAVVVSAIPGLIAWALSFLGIGLGATLLWDSYGVGFSVFGTVVSLIAGVISIALHVLAIGLAVVLTMFTDAMTMHLVVTGRLESAFSLAGVLAVFRKEPGKLFCASVVPGLAAIAAVMLGNLALSLVSDALDVLPFGMVGTGLFDPIGGLGANVVLAALVGLAAFCVSCGSIVRYRAVGYWAQRFAPSWKDETEHDCALPFAHRFATTLRI